MSLSTLFILPMETDKAVAIHFTFVLTYFCEWNRIFREKKMYSQVTEWTLKGRCIIPRIPFSWYVTSTFEGLFDVGANVTEEHLNISPSKMVSCAPGIINMHFLWSYHDQITLHHLKSQMKDWITVNKFLGGLEWSLTTFKV